MKVPKKYLLLVILAAFLPQIALAQLDNEYFVADQLLRQQKFEQAYEKFYQLHQDNPGTFIFLDKTTECLINLKKYDEAISLTEKAISRGNYQAQASIRLGEIYHVGNNEEKAFEIWDQVLDKYAGSQQVHLRVARAMKDRRAYDHAIEIYKQTRDELSDSNVVTSELAETYLQAGRYEEAIQEYLRLVKSNPDRMNYVQRRLIRFKDDYVYDVAILEISDFLDNLSPNHASYHNLQQLEIWLLMERKLFKRALVTAKNFEAQTSDITYSLYSLGSKLLAEQEFALAEEAYSYYINENIHSVKNRSKEELATVYTEWARYLDNYNLGLSSRRNELYQKAFDTLESLRTDAPNYQRIDQVLVSLSELSLDVLHQPERAAKYLKELRNFSDSSLMAQEQYIEGRLHLYDKEYTRARIAFTQSNKQERIGDLAQKTRYYLALTDFFAGDYEFAKIQLNSLERQNTSYFANDAVQLRLWIQNGLQIDTTGKQLEPFARAVEHFSQGNDQLGIEKLKGLFEVDGYNPLVDEALLELSTHKNGDNAVFVYRTLSDYLSTSQSQISPLYERLLWEKARIADQFVTNEEIDVELPQSKPDSLTVESRFFKDGTLSQVSVPGTIEQLTPMYEQILLKFPNGFYSSYARERIQELQNLQT